MQSVLLQCKATEDSDGWDRTGWPRSAETCHSGRTGRASRASVDGRTGHARRASVASETCRASVRRGAGRAGHASRSSKSCRARIALRPLCTLNACRPKRTSRTRCRIGSAGRACGALRRACRACLAYRRDDRTRVNWCGTIN